MRLCTFALAALLAACGNDDTMASKSARAYRDAVAKGTPAAGGHEHGGHVAATATTSAPATAAHEGHGAAEPAATQHDAHDGHPSTGAADPHAAHRAGSQATADPHAQHRAATATPAQTDPHAQHRGATATPEQTDPHAQHRAGGRTSRPPGGQDVRPPDPPFALQQDPFDAPNPLSAAEAAKDSPPEGAMYSCPMHPEVTSDEPGTCPKCGMALVKRN